MPTRYRANDPDMQAAGRTPESFAYAIVELWSGSETDRIYTDDRNEALIVAGKMLDEAYDALVVAQVQEPVRHYLALDPVNLA